MTQDLPLDEVPSPDDAPEPDEAPSPDEAPELDEESLSRGARARPRPAEAPLYKGEPLDPARGPGLGCFWFQVVLLAILLVLTPLTVVWAAPPWVSATLLIVSLVLLLFAGQTVIFLLRLVAADRSTRRRPMGPTARRTVGMIEDEAATTQGEEIADDDGAP